MSCPVDDQTTLPATRESRLDALAAHINRRPRVWLPLFALLLAVQVGGWWYPTLDGTRYLSAARQLARGESLTGLAEGVLPGYPLLISPAFRVSDRPFLVLAVVQWMLAVIFLAGVYSWTKAIDKDAAVLVAGVAVLNLGFGLFYRRTLKEMAFAAVLIWGAIVLNRLLRANRAGQRAWMAIAATGLIVALVSIRLTGVVLAVGLAWSVLWNRGTEKSTATKSAWWLAAVGSLLILTATAVLGTRYQSYLAGFFFTSHTPLEIVVEGFRTRVSAVGRLTVPGMYKAYAGPGEWLNVNTVIYVALFSVLSVGWWQLARRTKDVLVLSLPFYFALYVIWPYEQGARFFVCLVPVFVACLWRGITVMRRRPLPPGWLFLLVVAHAGTSFGYWIGVDAPRARAAHRQWAAVDELAQRLRHDPRDIAVSGEISDTMAMFQLAIDREVHWQETGQPVPLDVLWLLAPREQSPPSRFAVHRSIGNLALMRRQSSSERARMAVSVGRPGLPKTSDVPSRSVELRTQ